MVGLTLQQAWVIMVFFFSYCRGAIFSYVYTPACATSIGCSFSDKIWNSTEPMTENDDVIIESNVSIIISIYSTSVSLATLVFGVQGSPVTINIVNSTVDLSGNTTLNVRDTGSLAWGPESILTVYSSDITFGDDAYGACGYTLSLFYSTYTAPLALAVTNLTVGYSNVFALGLLNFNYTTAQYSTFTTLNFNVDTFFSYSNTLNVLSVEVFGYAILENNTGLEYSFDNTRSVVFNVAPFAYVEVYDTLLVMDSLSLSEGGYFTFEASNNSNVLIASEIDGKFGSYLFMGNNTNSYFGDGMIDIYTLNLGVDATIYFSAKEKTVVTDIQQPYFGSASIIINAGEVSLWTQSQPFYGSIYVYNNFGPATLAVVDQLILGPGSLIKGDGLLYISGMVNCSVINIHTVQMALANSVITVDSMTASMVYPDYMGSSPVKIFGNLNIVPLSPLDGIKFSEMFILAVYGNYTQHGGHMNFSVHDKHSTTFGCLQVSGSALLDHVAIGVVTDTTSVASSERWFLVEGLNLSLPNLSIFDVYPSSKYRSYYIIGENELFLAYDVFPPPDDYVAWFTELQYLLIFGGGILFVVVFVGVVVVAHNRKRKSYESID